ncbi:MAG: SusC/RagA family TonB-linked outer membrane protein [Bacteroidetes bacterium]|nr:MAG: SusC/RagA family TonB-linked outer membrane protein [Bacteroidota bacterium]
MKKLLIILMYLPFLANTALSQISVTGTITSADDGTTIPGVTVIIKGTTAGTTSDMNGQYSLRNVPEDATLVFSFIGMQTKEVPVEGRTIINVVLEMAAIGIDEVVVIGYGTARSADLTAPIPVVSGADIVRNITSNPASALQGAAPGVQIINRGGPGSNPEINIRGIASMQGAQPLFVVDGMFYDNINWLSANDIESIAILKDASAASIYGVRAAGGVIMVTTRQGRRGEGIIIEYDGYVGYNSTSNIMQMTNGEQYSTLLIEQDSYSRLLPSINIWGGRDFTLNGEQYVIPATDTDWYNELLGVGRVMNHSLTFRGGTDLTTYHVGASYMGQEGLLQSDHTYERINLKASVNFNPYNFLDLGTNIILNHTHARDEGSVWGAMYSAVPITPVREETGEYAGVIQAGYQVGPVNNPVAMLDFMTGNFNFTSGINLMYNAHANLKLTGDDRLVFRTQFSHEIRNNNNRVYVPVYFVDDKLRNENSSLSKRYNYFSALHLDHTLTYKDNIGNHNFTVLGGFSTRQVDARHVGGSARDVPGLIPEYLYFGNSEDPDPASFNVFDGGFAERGVSYFGRLMYNFNHRYLLNTTFRADGTDKYSQTWGYFPSVGVGWVVSEESFMDNQELFDFVKLRASWGQLGNNAVPRESGTREIFTGIDNSYIFGNDQIIPGYVSSVFFNELEWELTEETNAGIELSTFDSRLYTEIDWFYRVTKNAAIWTSNLMGAGGLIRNVGEILNTGMEFSINWQDETGGLRYNVRANLGTLRNEVLSLGGEPYIDAGSAEFRRRTEVGHPLYSFYGYKVIGVYQNWEEIEEHLDTSVHTQVEPGFLKFEDLNGDGIIDENDRQYLGANIPDFTYGGQISLEYRNWDFFVSLYGVSGNKLINRLRGNRAWHADYNFDLDLYENRWTGEGSTNSYPSAKGMVNSWNLNPLNSFLVEDGSFFRIQNITLGYTFRDILPGSQSGSTIRVRFAAQNPLTFFKFNGFTPEVTGQGEAAGVYPIPTSFTLGVNITY